MKRNSIWKAPVLAVLMILAAWTWTLAQTQEFSADQILLGPGGEQQGKIYFKQDRWRVEMTQTQMQKDIVQIFRMDKKVAWMLIPEDKVYMETPLSPDMTPWAKKIPGEIGRKSLGEETVQGQLTEKYQVKVFNGEIAQEIYLWMSKELKVPVKTQTLDGKFGIELKNIQMEPQPEDLFELPPDFKKITPPLQS